MKYSVNSIIQFAICLFAFTLCFDIEEANSDSIGFPVDGPASTTQVGLVEVDGTIRYFIPFTSSASGIYAVDGNGTVGTVSDTGSPGGTLTMYLAFGPLAAPPPNAIPKLTFTFDDLDLNGASDGGAFRETIRFVGNAGSTPVIESINDDTPNYSITGNSNTQSIIFSDLSLISNLTNQSHLFLRVDFASVSANGGNTAEKLKALFTYVCPNENQTPGICGCGVSDIDSDDDGIPDCNDQCPLDPKKSLLGVCGCGIAETDSDNDGTPDCKDLCPADSSKQSPGQCGCGVSDLDSDNDGVSDCTDQCPLDRAKLTAGVCGCGLADADLNSNGIIDCIDIPGDQCTGRCYDGYPDLDQDNDGVSNCTEIEDGTDGCDSGSFKERLSANACSGPNGFFDQINVLTVINHQTNASLKARVEYRDLKGQLQDTVKITLPPEQRKDLIINELGLLPDSYGTVCVYTNAKKSGAWSGGLTLYKERYNLAKGTPLKGLTANTNFDYALYYSLTNAIKGVSTVSLNTNTLGTDAVPNSMVANWVRLTDAIPRDGKGLVGVLYYYDANGKRVGKHKVSLKDGGRYDFPAHEPIGQGAIGLAEFKPSNNQSEYYFEVSRYVYEGPIFFKGNLWTAYTLPNRRATGASTIGKLSTQANELAVVELINASNSSITAPFQVFDGKGVRVMKKNVFIPRKASRHILITGGALLAGFSGSAEVSGPPESVAARTLVYRFSANRDLFFAYSPTFLEPGGSVQRSPFNSFINNESMLEVTNSTNQTISAVVRVLNFDRTELQRFNLNLGRQGTKRIKLAPPRNTYGTVVVDSAGKPGLVIRNDVSRTSEYTLSFPGN